MIFLKYNLSFNAACIENKKIFVYVSFAYAVSRWVFVFLLEIFGANIKVNGMELTFLITIYYIA